MAIIVNEDREVKQIVLLSLTFFFGVNNINTRLIDAIWNFSAAMSAVSQVNVDYFSYCSTIASQKVPKWEQIKGNMLEKAIMMRTWEKKTGHQINEDICPHIFQHWLRWNAKWIETQSPSVY